MRAGGSGAARGWRAAAIVSISLLAAAASRAESCLEGAQSRERAARTRTTYQFAQPGLGVDASGVLWRDAGHHAVRLRGTQDACWSGGAIEGAYPEDAVYECKLEHGYRGGPCRAFHTTAGMAPEVAAAATVIEDVRISHYGDGVSLEPSSGDVIVRRAWLHDLHDDAIENDFGRNITVSDSLIERTYMAFASRPRSRSRVDQRGRMFTVRGNLVQLHRFTNAYKQKPGHGGFFKWPEDGSGPRFAVTDNVFVVDDPGSGQLLLPLADQVAECRNNRLLWAGTRGGYQAWLTDGGGQSDRKRNNLARLQALSHCYTVVVKPFGQPKEAFLAEHWDPLVAHWRATHPAGAEAPAPGPDQAPAGSGSESTGSSSSSQASRKQAR
jgi:hypothetical protein